MSYADYKDLDLRPEKPEQNEKKKLIKTYGMEELRKKRVKLPEKKIKENRKNFLKRLLKKYWFSSLNLI